MDKQIGQIHTESAPALLRLPTEIHSLIAAHLELDARIILRRLTSKSLLPEKRHQSLLLPATRYSLAEARKASKDLQQLYLNPPSVSEDLKSPADHAPDPHSKASNSVFYSNFANPKPPPRIPISPMEKERDTGPEEEARFFVSSLNYLTGGCQGKKSQTERENEVPQIKLKSLSLVGWYGVSASMILNMLLELPVLSQVQTLVKTERFDSEVWKPSDLVWVFPPTCQLLKRRNVIRTQAIIQVGSKLRSNPEENSHLLKGFGLRMGYECWCFFETKSSDPTLPQDQEKRRTDQLSRLNANFHIIVQGRYSVNDALQLEDTLDKSFVTCNHCKNQIVF